MKLEQKQKLCLALALTAVVCITFLAIIGTRKPKEQEKTPSPLSSSEGSSVGSSVGSSEEAPTEETVLDKAKAVNPDTVAWLTIPNTEIDNAVMQSADNEYYLRRDERGRENVWGSYLADYYANLASPDSLIQNTVIYGHTVNNDDPDGKKFSQLFKYAELAFLQENPNIYLTVDNEKLTFEVFAVFYTDIDFYYIDPNPTDQGFTAFMQTVNAKNEYLFEGSTVTEQDKLLTLSGCSHKYDKDNTDNQRFVVMARQVDKDSASATTIKENPSPKRP